MTQRAEKQQRREAWAAAVTSGDYAVVNPANFQKQWRAPGMVYSFCGVGLDLVVEAVEDFHWYQDTDAVGCLNYYVDSPTETMETFYGLPLDTLDALFRDVPPYDSEEATVEQLVEVMLEAPYLGI